MKKWLFATLVVIIMGVGVFFLIGKENRDRFNPFIKEKDVYVLVNKEGKPDPDFEHRYMFLLDGVDESEKVEEIKVTSSVKNFPKNSYLKVHVKGKYVFEYEIVTEKDVPEKARETLKNR
ncbi:YxeA family protein [Heyndrickxia camelliae]|uniref:YxeA family protein n=1 Tax=Heyndrickxia camelliae TaxID=1707093 RepID=A0A2N3LM65_9BACI|nr:YxeA family protein [Heyndrickxia camelliae]PKR85696.1 hypothetical protein CWO92_08280 [Heyndrickxia camelliae]